MLPAPQENRLALSEQKVFTGKEFSKSLWATHFLAALYPPLPFLKLVDNLHKATCADLQYPHHFSEKYLCPCLQSR